MNFNKELAIALFNSNDQFPVDLDDAMQWWDCRTKDGSLPRPTPAPFFLLNDAIEKYFLKMLDI